jgi:cobalt/nickel transport system permease protein
LHHVVLERWSRGSSGLHRRDPRAKLFALLVFLVTVGTASRGLEFLGCVLLALVGAGLVWARIPISAALLRAGIVFSFTIPFALITFVAGEPSRAAALLVKSYLSALAALLVIGTTPAPLLLRGLESAQAPRFLLMVAQFLYRYLFVIAEEAQDMRKAALARGAGGRGRTARRERFQAASGALAALFARSYARAETIHRAMLARGFNGRFPALEELRFGLGDAVFAAAAAAIPVIARAAIERLAA